MSSGLTKGRSEYMRSANSDFSEHTRGNVMLLMTMLLLNLQKIVKIEHRSIYNIKDLKQIYFATHKRVLQEI